MRSARVPRPYRVGTTAPRAVTVVIRGPIERAHLPALTDRIGAVCARIRSCVVYCDVADLPADAVVVDALARLQLVARRSGCRVVVRHASAELRELADLMGLTDLWPDQAPRAP